MYNIDDTKDSDTNEYRQQASQKAHQQVKQVATGFNPDECLKDAVNTVSNCNTEEELTGVWKNFGAQLKGYQDHTSKLTDCLKIRKSEILGDK
jgi:hypothetical protein